MLEADKLEEKLKQLKQERETEREDIEQSAKASNVLAKVILEKHFADRVTLPKAAVPSIGKKEAGYSQGYIGQYKYIDDTQATFMVKRALNKTLNDDDKKELTENFKKSFFEGSCKQTKLLLDYSDAQVEALINAQWQGVLPNLCEDDLNMSDFVREYVAGGLYPLFLQDRAPVIELVKESEDKTVSEEHVYLRSKFLPEFETFYSLKKKRDDCSDVEGLEKLLAVSLILGEADAGNSENLGVIKKEGKRVFAKVDHGRSFYWVPYSLDIFFQAVFANLAAFGRPPSLVKSHQELVSAFQLFKDNEELVKNIIEQRVYNLEKILAHNITFSLRRISNDVLGQPRFSVETFVWNQEKKHFVSDQGNSLSDYFKNSIKKNLSKLPEEFSPVNLKSGVEKMTQATAMQISIICMLRKGGITLAIVLAVVTVATALRPIIELTKKEALKGSSYALIIASSISLLLLVATLTWVRNLAPVINNLNLQYETYKQAYKELEKLLPLPTQLTDPEATVIKQETLETLAP